MDGSLPEEVNRLKEDLTVARVILQSLESADFEGADLEREAAQADIDRLTEQLRAATSALKQKQAAGYSQSTSASFADEQTAPSGHSSPSSRTLDAMDSSQRSTDIWASPSALPRRKRDLEGDTSGFIDVRQKSRRTTPTPATPPNRSSSTVAPRQSAPPRKSDIAFIDLTGDDVEADSGYIAEQIRQEKLQKQENEDRRFAMQLSQGSGSRTPAGPWAPGSQLDSKNALSKLMATQRVSGPPFSSQDDDNDHLKVEYPGYSQPPLPFEQPQLPQTWQPQMPGGYNPSWDNPNANPRANVKHEGSFMSTQPQYPHAPVLPSQRSDNPFPNPAEMAGHGHAPQLGHSHVQRVQAFGAPATPLPGFGRPVMPPTGYLPSQRNNSHLGRVINNTSQFFQSGGSVEMDYSSMPERLAHFLEGAIHDTRVSEKELDELLQNIRPDMEIPLQERGQAVDGLRSNLYHHQELALAWMHKMEKGTNKGGILADDMGLGKTISTLSLILSRPATSRPKTNLIIGPLSLVRQWEDEIRNKTTASHRLSVFVYHNKKASIDDLLTYDVVLTTYGTIAQEMKRLDKFMKENAGRSLDFNDRTTSMKFPLLHPRKAIFYRVILDEAQCIKNKETQTAKACHTLKATYRWCLTGTPMMNGVIELYSLLCFLKIKPYCVWDRFRQAFGKLFGRNGDEKAAAMSRLRALLKAVMLRRKKDSKLDGKPILRLPTKTEEIVYAELSEDERDYYNQLEKKSQVQFSKYLREGSIGKNYSNILVLLLRLRQACCHPHLNVDVEDAAPPMDEASMMELVKKLEPGIIARIKEMEAFECPICYDAVPSPCFFVPCGHDSCQQCLSRLTDNAQAENLQAGTESDKARCPVCRTLFDPRQCFSYETFKMVHMPHLVKKEAEDDEDNLSDLETESEDGDDSDEQTKNGDLKGFLVDDHFFSDSDGGADSDGEQKVKTESKAEKVRAVKEEDSVAAGFAEMQRRKKMMKKGKKKAKASASAKKGKEKAKDGSGSTTGVKPSMIKALRIEARKNREAHRKYMNYLRETWMPAAKVTECMRLLKEAEDESSQNKGKAPEKTIVFSQWTLLLDLIEVAMEHDGHKNKARRYDGSMSGEERNIAAKAFQDPNRKDVTVLLVSLRAGNAGLNLTQATRVIIMDPFWNPYIEMQAVDRAHRIGQQRQLKVYRILTKDTVEDRIVELKERKQAIVEAALDEAESAKIGRLGVSELKFLFNRQD